MITTKTWDDYLTESAKVEDAGSSHTAGATTIGGIKSSRNPFLKHITEREVSNTDGTLTAITSEPVISSTTEETSLTETVLKNPCDKNTLDSLDSIDSCGYGETKTKSTRERFLLFDSIRDSTSGSSSKIRKDVFDNHLREAMKSAKLSTKLKHRTEGGKGPKIFGGNFKYMKGYLKSALPLSEIEKENKSTSENPSSTSNDVTSSDVMTKLQQELKSSRRKIQNLKDMSATAVRRKDELQEEVLSAHKEITDLKIALQASTDKQHEFEIEMRIAKARVGEAEREAAIAIGQSNKLEREVQDTERKRQTNWDKLIAAEQKINGLEENLNDTKEEHRQEIEAKHKIQQQLETKQYELRRSKKDIDELKSEINEKENEKHALVHQSEQLMTEKAKCEGQIEELTKSNVSLKEELTKLQGLYNISERSVETSNLRVTEQKEKFEAMIASRVQIEGEISEMHKELSKQKNEKHVLSAELSRLLESFNQSEVLTEKYRCQYEDLEKENSKLRDKVLYLELYKKVIDSKSISLDELKSSGTKSTITTKINSPKTLIKDDYPHFSEKYNSRLDIEKITRKLEEIKEEEERQVMQRYIDPIVLKDGDILTPMSSKGDGFSGSQSPFDVTMNDNKQSMFSSLIMTNISRPNSVSNANSEADSDNKNNKST